MSKLRLHVVDVSPSTVVIARSREDVDVREVCPGTVLVTQPRRARQNWIAGEKKLSAYLMQEHVAALLRMYKVNCVIDVGAHHGEYARRLRAAGYSGHIVSFEPVLDAFAKLQQRAADDPRWSVHRYALGRADGVRQMNVMGGPFSSMLGPTRFGAGRYAALRQPQKQKVEMRRLDTLLDAMTAHVPDPRLYLKLDTQGFDLEVFAGLGDRVRDFTAMQSEVAVLRIYEGMPRMCEALEVYEGAGFNVTGMYPVSRQTRTGRVVEFDCVLVRRPSPVDRN